MFQVHEHLEMLANTKKNICNIKLFRETIFNNFACQTLVLMLVYILCKFWISKRLS